MISLCNVSFFFFFSSRRRHTRSTRDWSSDVCSSDLIAAFEPDGTQAWSHDLGDRIEALEVGAAGEIYAGCWHGVVALGSDGSQRWFRETTGAVLSLARVGGRLYAGSRDGWVYQIDVPSGFIVVDLDVATLISRHLVQPPELEAYAVLELLGPIPPKPKPKIAAKRRVRSR